MIRLRQKRIQHIQLLLLFVSLALINNSVVVVVVAFGGNGNDNNDIVVNEVGRVSSMIPTTNVTTTTTATAAGTTLLHQQQPMKDETTMKSSTLQQEQHSTTTWYQDLFSLPSDGTSFIYFIFCASTLQTFFKQQKQDNKKVEIEHKQPPSVVLSLSSRFLFVLSRRCTKSGVLFLFLKGKKMNISRRHLPKIVV